MIHLVGEFVESSPRKDRSTAWSGLRRGSPATASTRARSRFRLRCGCEAPMAVWVFRSGRRGAISTRHTPLLSHRRRLSRTPLRGFTQPGVKPTRSAQPRKMARVFAARSTVHCSARPSSSSPATPHRTSSSRGSGATCGLDEESPPWSLPQDGSQPAVRSRRRERSNGRRQTP